MMSHPAAGCHAPATRLVARLLRQRDRLRLAGSDAKQGHARPRATAALSHGQALRALARRPAGTRRGRRRRRGWHAHTHTHTSSFHAPAHVAVLGNRDHQSIAIFDPHAFVRARRLLKFACRDVRVQAAGGRRRAATAEHAAHKVGGGWWGGEGACERQGCVPAEPSSSSGNGNGRKEQRNRGAWHLSRHAPPLPPSHAHLLSTLTQHIPPTPTPSSPPPPTAAHGNDSRLLAATP